MSAHLALALLALAPQAAKRSPAPTATALATGPRQSRAAAETSRQRQDVTHEIAELAAAFRAATRER